MDNLTGKLIGKYKILEEIGQGGMAIVYKGIDTMLGRLVAIKIIQPDQVTSEKFIKRFLREAKVLANLAHANIVKVFDYGEYEGSPYLVMEYISGGSLSSMVGTPMNYTQAAQLIIPIARALDHVHKQKIVHRDIKPANILINDSGQPLLSDFGILKIIDTEESQGITGTGMVVGTPAYMSPEQIKGKPVDGRVDIYALGVMFFELITGKKPYEADSAIELSLKHINEPIPKAKQIIRDLPIEVDQIISKAMAKDCDNRYQSMEIFINSLLKLIKKDFGKEIDSFGSISEEFAKVETPKNKKIPIYIAIASGLTIIIVLSYFLWVKDLIFPVIEPTVSISDVSNESMVAFEDLKTKTPTVVPPTETLLPTLTPTLKPTRTPTETVVTTIEPVSIPKNVISVLTAKNVAEINRLEKISVIDFEWIQNTNQIINAGSSGLSLIDPSTMTIAQRISLGGNIPNAFAVSQSGEFAYVLIGVDLYRYSLQTFQLVNDYAISTGTYSIAVSNDGKKIGLGILDNKVQIIDSESGQVLSTFRSNYGGWSISFSNDDKYIAVGTSQGALLWEVNTGLWIPLQSGQNNKIYSLNFSEDNSLLAAGSNNSIFVWEIPSGMLLYEFTGEFGNVNGIDISSNNELLISGTDNKQVDLWDLESGNLIKTLTGHSSAIFSLHFSPDNQFIASGANEGIIRLWGIP